MFQSTGSRGARQRSKKSTKERITVSIHGLAWSPTGIRSRYSRVRSVSIHGLAWSPTQGALKLWGNYTRFNPRARVEPDVSPPAVFKSPAEFQSTGSRGARPESEEQTNDRLCFNPRARVEPDRGENQADRREGGFNPRARVEPDRGRVVPGGDLKVSIHGLAWSPTNSN